MNAPTVWEEGRLAGSRVIRLAVLACAVIIAAHAVWNAPLGWLFDVSFVLVCIAAALAVRPGDFFHVGVLPPFLLLGFSVLLAVFHTSQIANAGDGFGQAVVSGMAHHSGALFAADVNALVVLAIRHRVASNRHDRMARRLSPYAVTPRPPDDGAGYSKRAGSPRPTLVTSGVPEEKSTTVVGSAEVSPASRTASSH